MKRRAVSLNEQALAKIEQIAREPRREEPNDEVAEIVILDASGAASAHAPAATSTPE